ncbi:MAG: hypothetical protein HYX72_09315 [Acidobacteria bacterium]|nr:hypothetical protein [Acidobacteriota bacterium]
MLANWQDGRIKLYITATGLRLRKRLSQLFLRGEYVPLIGEGDKKDHVVAFARVWEGQCVIALVPRLVARLVGPGHSLPVGKETWGETSIVLSEEFVCHKYQNVFTQEEIRLPDPSDPTRIAVGEALRVCPVALLVGHRD